MSFIGVICGLKSEAKTVERAVASHKLRIGISGANAARAEECASSFCDEGAAAIISVGVSGGLDPALEPGQLIVGDKTIAGDGSIYASDHALLEAAKASMRDAGHEEPLVSSLYGSDEIIDSAQKKQALRTQFGTVAVDMESHGAARAAARKGVPFIALRAIADPADRALPAAALNAVAPDGSTRIIATLGAAMRDPKQFPALMKLGADSAAATKALRRDLGPLFLGFFLSLNL
ncbi:hypothetical protein ABFZ85_03880 [Hyphococcus formosus]|uniref:phosphorylase family protein n=1 Tax=Hyphococcus formosus TaxID=3143534 RepID=UPI00398B08F9